MFKKSSRDIKSILKKIIRKFDETFSLVPVVFFLLVFDYIKCILSCVKNFNEFTDFQWFVIVSLMSLVFYGICLVCAMLEIKIFITYKDDDKQ